MAGRLNSDPLFIGLTRPSLIFGVSIYYALMNMLLCTAWFIYESSIKIIFVGAFVHLIGYLLCFKEPRLMELYMLRNAKCGQCRNKFFYGGNSYDV